MQQLEAASPDEVFSVVSNAASQDPQLVTLSSKRLKELLLLPGTFDFLSQISIQRTLPLSMRQQSIIQLKNAALPHWKAKRLLSDEQRAQIRGRTLSLLEEEDETIAECNKVILSKVARIDYPNNWQSLISDIMLALNGNLHGYMSSRGSDRGASLLLRRRLTAMNSILKEFSSIKMPAGIKVMGELVRQLQPVFQSHYAALASTFELQLTPQNYSTHEAEDVLQLAHVAYKCLSKMNVWLWHRQTINNQMDLIPWVQTFFASSASQLRILYELRINLALALEKISNVDSKPAAERTLTSLTLHIKHLGKFFRRLQQLNVSRFILLPGCSDLVLYYWSKVVHATNGPLDRIADSPLAVFPSQYIVQAMVLFKESLAQWTPAKQGDNNDATLSKDFVEEAVRLLVTRFIPLNSYDLNKWYEDPEEWVNAESVENDQWEYEPRACAERVLITLANQYKLYVAPLLTRMFEQVADQRAVSLEEIIQKEAVYCAIGRCAIRLKDIIPFGSWVAQTLKAEAFEEQHGYAIIKRRIAWLLGRWLSEECAPPNNDIVWIILVHLLSDHGPGTDVAVRLAAATALRECVDTNGFIPEIFIPYLPSAMSLLVQLAAEAGLLESRRRVMNALNVVIERMQHQVVAHNHILINAIPSLWTNAGVDYLFKASMLITINTAVDASKEQSRMFDVVTVPLLRECLTVPDSRSHLDEDALNLWLAVLRNAARSGLSDLQPIIGLFPIACALLSENLDLLGSILEVVESYIVLDADSILRIYSTDFFRACVKAINQAPTPHVKDTIIMLQSVFQLTPGTSWAEPMYTSGLFSCLLLQLNEDRGNTNIRTELILAFARMAIADGNLVVQLMSASASLRGCSEGPLWNELLDQWWRRFDNMSEPRNRKLVAMGIACLVATGRREVLDRLNGEIFNLWLDVFGEIKESMAESEGEDNDSQVNLLWQDADFDKTTKAQDTEGTPEHARRKCIYETDLVKSEKLTVYIAQRLQLAQNVYGYEKFQKDFLDNADAAVLKQLQDELTSKSM